ncbi:dehydrogenase [Bacillus sp. MUM 13]|nr:SDR family oxidoreductase [Bacillus sp. MUM 13]OIK14754.1 dehydrogenase [Bacillus sp. MUM 13]
MQLLSGKHIVVTGGSSGLGYSMAESLLEEGASVAIRSRPGDKLDKAVQQLSEKGHDVYKLPMDVRSEESVQAAVDWVRGTWGGLDVLVNNAGIGMRTVNAKFLTEPQPFYEVSPDSFRNLVDTNLTGYFLAARGFVSLMLQQGKGKIINISMNHETMKRKGFVPYGPSRAATESLSYIMAEDLKEHGITVNMLLPGGATLTGMIPDEARKAFEGSGSLLEPEVMRDGIVYLASEKSDGVTGERIVAAEFNQWLKEKR